MNNEPVAWRRQLDTGVYMYQEYYFGEAEPLYTNPAKELNDGGELVKNATYWKRQYNLMASQNDNLKSGLYHANEQIKYLESHPAKELHLSLQKDKETGELLAVTYTDDEHRIVELLWQRPPVKEQDESFDRTASHMAGEYVSYQKELTDEEILGCWVEEFIGNALPSIDFARAILKRASEK